MYGMYVVRWRCGRTFVPDVHTYIILKKLLMLSACYRQTLFALLLLCALSSCQTGEATAEERDTTITTNAGFDEPHRPQFHFSPPQQWMNDPNGMVYLDGEYHLFYQHHPDSNVWGPMHWGHAVSPDLVHWEHLPIALYPDSLGTIFSGSAVVDVNNTSGFGRNALVAIFTYHDAKGEQAGRNDFQTQGIAYSTDRGRTWTKYEGNPVVPNPGIRDFRDPKVIWHEPSGQWVMIFAAKDRVKLYGSPDLKSWTHLSDFGENWGSHGGVWECPDLFELPVEGTGESRWVILLSINPGGPNGGSATQYFVGNFDGRTFTLDPDFAQDLRQDSAIFLDYGRDNYAGVTWANVPENDGRRLFLGWMSNWDYAQVVPTEAWRSAMTLPRTLSLRPTPEGLRVYSQPVTELQKLRGASHTLPAQSLSGTVDLKEQLPFAPTLLEAEVTFARPANGQIGLQLINDHGDSYRIGYDAGRNAYFSDRRPAGQTRFSNKFAPSIHYGPRIADGDSIRLHVYFDVASAELFADNGATVMTDIFFPNEPFNRLRLFSTGQQPAELRQARFFELASIWK